ncbi:MAG: amidohydrolase, partial [Acidobacteriota bacterium]
CFEAGALATGSELEVIGGGKPYAEMIHDPEILAVFRKNCELLGRPFPESDLPGSRFSASTDMGNVSHAVPSIHPMIGIDSFPEVNHQPGFTQRCIAEPADRAVYEGALAMAWTAIDLAADESLRTKLLAKK